MITGQGGVASSKAPGLRSGRTGCIESCAGDAARNPRRRRRLEVASSTVPLVEVYRRFAKPLIDNVTDTQPWFRHTVCATVTSREIAEPAAA
jgi:hypothetical protein